MQVVALIHEENGFFGVSFPDFPGCTTVGDTAAEALTKAPEVLVFHVDGLAEDGAVPEVRTLDEIKADPEFREDFVGAVVALVPFDPSAASTWRSFDGRA